MGLSTECKLRRALLSVSDKTGLVCPRRGSARPSVSSSCPPAAPPASLVEAGPRRAQRLGGDGLPRDARRARQDAASRHPWRHPRASRSGLTTSRPSAGTASSRVDLVVVNLYPFATAAANPATTFDGLVEEIDIGGPSLVRAAAKNFRDVLVVVDPATTRGCSRRSTSRPDPRPRSGSSSHARPSPTRRRTTRRLPRRSRGRDGGRRWIPAPGAGGHRPADRAAPALDAMPGAAVRREPAPGGGLVRRAGWRPASATSRSFRARSCPTRISWTSTPPRASSSSSTSRLPPSIKHTNPCGAATGRALADAYVAARDADPLSAFGGIVGLNRPLDAETARAIVSTFIEAVIAPAVADEAPEILATEGQPARAHRRLLGVRACRARRAGTAIDPGRTARPGARSGGRSLLVRGATRRETPAGRHASVTRRPTSGRPFASRGVCAPT